MVTPHFPPVIAGAGVHVYNLAKGLMANGVEVRVHTLKRYVDVHSKNSLDLELDDLDVVPCTCLLNLTNRDHRVVGNEDDQPLSLSYITSTIKAGIDFDVVHVHDGQKICNDLLILALRRLKPNKPIVFTPHGLFATISAYKRGNVSSFAYFSSKIYWLLGIPYNVIRIPNRVIAVNSTQVKMFTEACGDQKVSLIPEAVPSHYYVDKPTFLDNKKLRILFVGRIIEEKGIKDLLLAIHKVTKVYDKSKLELVCIGPDYGYLQEALRIISDLKLNSVVKLVGSVPEIEKLRFLSWCDVFVLPSYHEAFGLTILEAMARGKPVIATETQGARFLVKNHETGFLVRLKDSEGIASALLKFVQDPNLKSKMGHAALEYASEFNMKNMVQSHVNLYENVLSC